MNRMLLFSLLLIFSCAIFKPAPCVAQDSLSYRTSVLISPVALVAGNYSKIRIRLQHGLREHFAFGLDFKYYFPKEYPGFQVMPFVKYYFKKSTVKGIYAFVHGVYGKNQGQPLRLSEYYPCYGGGAGAGILIPLGDAQRWVIEFTGGVKFVHTESALSSGNVPGEYDDYYIIGPGSFPEGTIAFGYSF